MKFLRKPFVFFIIPLFLTGCLFDDGVLWKDEQYHVAWIDTGDSKTLYFSLENNAGIGKLGPEVIAVGSDEFYVVAQRKITINRTDYY